MFVNYYQESFLHYAANSLPNFDLSLFSPNHHIMAFVYNYLIISVIIYGILFYKKSHKMSFPSIADILRLYIRRKPKKVFNTALLLGDEIYG